MLTEETRNKIKESMIGYPDKGGGLMSALHAVQNNDGWLSQESMKEAADVLNLPPALVKGVASFYAMYRRGPSGRHLVQMCTNVACMILGAESLVAMLKREYGLEQGGTTQDGRFSLIIMECIGACGTAPALLVNDDFYDNLDEKRVREILDGYK